jgi:hypothetical protein
LPTLRLEFERNGLFYQSHTRLRQIAPQRNLTISALTPNSSGKLEFAEGEPKTQCDRINHYVVKKSTAGAQKKARKSILFLAFKSITT